MIVQCVVIVVGNVIYSQICLRGGVNCVFTTWFCDVAVTGCWKRINKSSIPRTGLFGESDRLSDGECVHPYILCGYRPDVWTEWWSPGHRLSRDGDSATTQFTYFPLTADRLRLSVPLSSTVHFFVLGGTVSRSLQFTKPCVSMSHFILSGRRRITPSGGDLMGVLESWPSLSGSGGPNVHGPAAFSAVLLYMACNP